METSLPSVSLHEEIHYLFTTSKYIVCVLITRTSISPSGVAFQTAVGEIITSDLIGRPLGVKDSDSAVNSWTVIGKGHTEAPGHMARTLGGMYLTAPG